MPGGGIKLCARNMCGHREKCNNLSRLVVYGWGKLGSLRPSQDSRLTSNRVPEPQKSAALVFARARSERLEAPGPHHADRRVGAGPQLCSQRLFLWTRGAGDVVGRCLAASRAAQPLDPVVAACRSGALPGIRNHHAGALEHRLDLLLILPLLLIAVLAWLVRLVLLRHGRRA